MNAALQHGGISKLPLLKSQADPIDWLVKNLEVNRLGESEIVEVSLPPRTGFSGKEQATIINAVVGAYIEEVADKDRKQMLQRQETLKKLSKTYSEMMKTRRETIRHLAWTASPAQTISDPGKIRRVAATPGSENASNRAHPGTGQGGSPSEMEKEEPDQVE